MNKDPLDKVFVDYHKQLVRDEDGAWEIKKIDASFINWVNNWGNSDNHKDNENFRLGYNEAILDVCKLLKMNWKRYDKRTKDGFNKND